MAFELGQQVRLKISLYFKDIRFLIWQEYYQNSILSSVLLYTQMLYALNHYWHSKVIRV